MDSLNKEIENEMAKTFGLMLVELLQRPIIQNFQ